MVKVNVNQELGRIDHSVIPFSEKELCRHTERCPYKPNCIFFHPEDEKEEQWKTSRTKVAKICRYSENGQTCMRAVCHYYHPIANIKMLVFHWDQLTKPPLRTMPEMMSSTQKIPPRVPVIVKNMMSKEEFPDLHQSLKGLALD